ncbi:unnamed protein product [Linum tenue]|uniref:F-box domain-containing protein n=1 Tax=Linum tenue TaxID=586396 RepID=A0AAV0M243_9ROSI|nr:unnamed protein product [Linum tenue]
MDGVSNLPDDILLHILSFLEDSKSAVQTSVLSRRWRHLWKDVSALHLDQNSFSTRERCRTFVRNFLSRRSTRLDKVSFTTNHTEETGKFLWSDHEPESLGMVLAYDGRTGPDHDPSRRRLLRLRASLGHRGSLELFDCFAVELGVVLRRCFGALTTLELRHCLMTFDNDGGGDPFAALPRLNCLKLLDCRVRRPRRCRRFKVSGLQLRELEIRHHMADDDDDDSLAVSEVLAPKLESFCCTGRVSRVERLRELDFPCLVRASVHLTYCSERVAMGWVSNVTMRLVRGLRSAESLDLCLKDMVGSTHKSPPVTPGNKATE